MSSMIQQPPARIAIGGGGGAPGGPPQGPGGDPSGGDPLAAFKAALDKLSQDATEALTVAHDAIDKQAVTDILAKVHALLAGHQKEEDTIMGGGPGARMIRRSTPPKKGGAPSGPGGY